MPGVEQQAWPHATELREVRGPLSVEAAARRIGVTRQTWAGWEKGTQVPTYDNLRAIVEEFECPPDLVGYEPPRGYELVPSAWLQQQNELLNEKLDRILDAIRAK